MRGRAKKTQRASVKRRRGLLARIAHGFRERQIYVRSQGHVQYITLRPWMQVVCLFAMLSGVFLLGFVSINATFKDQLLALKERRIHQVRLNHEDRLGELRQVIDRLNGKLMLDQNGYLGEVDKLRLEYEALVERHNSLAEFLRGGRPGEANRDEEALNPQSGSQGRGDKGSLNELTMRQKYAADFRNRDQALEPLAELRRMFVIFEDLQVALLDEAIERRTVRMAAAEKLFTGLGISATAVVEPVPEEIEDGVGGPFLPVALVRATSLDVADRMVRVDRIASRTSALLEAARKLPLALPIGGDVDMSSGYGLRRDPFRRVASMHAGVDFRGGYREPVHATADGLVVKAGWEGAYGRIVRIRHAHGVTTRYAHLSRLKVRTGQKVSVGDVIGLMGSTGRSTGRHLHYETRVRGRAINPARFWKVRDGIRSVSQ